MRPDRGEPVAVLADGASAGALESYLGSQGYTVHVRPPLGVSSPALPPAWYLHVAPGQGRAARLLAGAFLAGWRYAHGHLRMEVERAAVCAAQTTGGRWGVVPEDQG